MKISTGTGDRGKTSLFTGERVSKANLRVEAYGDLDELNAALGTLAATLTEADQPIREEIKKIQGDIFHMSARLASPLDAEPTTQLPSWKAQGAKWLEEAIENWEQILPPLDGFILPGGTVSAGLTHLARTVCRRAERHVVALQEKIDNQEERAGIGNILIYLNRLSDYLFLLARRCNQTAGKPDILWHREYF